MDNLTDFDRTMTPFAAGLGRFINFDNTDFIGRDALPTAPQDQLLFGVRCDGGPPAVGDELVDDGDVVGHVTVGDWVSDTGGRYRVRRSTRVIRRASEAVMGFVP